MKKIILLLLFTVSLFGEYIELYNTKVVINSNSKVSIKEDILYNFDGAIRHGIYRDIPKNDTLLKNLKVLQNGRKIDFKLIDNQKYWRIRIGNPNYTVTGKVKYTLSYNLEGMIVRANKSKNFIAYDLVGAAWKKPIKKAIGIVYLPKKLQNKVNIQAFKGKFGSTTLAHFENHGSYIKVEANNLAPHEALTIYLSFDKNIMPVSQKPNFKYYEKPIYYLFLAPIFALFYFVAKRFNIFHNIGSIAPKYRPPKDLTIMEAGLLKDNFVDFDEIKPAILELANLGYIKIEEEDGKLFLVKVKDNDENLNEQQNILLDEIFLYHNRVANSSLKLHNTIFDKLKGIVHNSLVNKGYYSASLKSSRESFIFGAFALGALTIGAFSYYIFKDTGFDILVPIAISLIFIAIGIVNFISAIKRRDFSGIIFFLVWSIFSSIFLFNILGSNDIAISLILMLVIIAIGSFLIYKRMNTLTFKGELAKRHILGLKEFIKRADRDKIKFFLQEDKKYLDKMLPYALLFGLNKHWLKLYHELDAPMPDWYSGGFDSFDTIDFSPTVWNENSGLGSTSISSGDFSDFGSFSGGGFGGGGGDSW